jgi:hypothetical protein
MRTFIFIFSIQLCLHLSVAAQQKQIIPDLSTSNDSKLWVLYNRELTTKGKEEVYLNSKPNDGLLWFKGLDFRNGKIELDIKGRDKQGMSFVGIAFHGINDSTYDAIYFRAFNFKNQKRNGHSVQYIAHPKYTWYKLREEHPNKFENRVSPVPEPNDWFHVTIIVEFPVVKVFVNNASKPTLEIKQLSNQKEGWVGFWVGNNSDGYFRNLKVISE